MFDMDESRDEWTEEIYENQARYPLSSWPDEKKSYWTNVVRGQVHFVESCTVIASIVCLCVCVRLETL